MKPQRLGLLALITLLATILIPVPLNLKAPLYTPQALAQTLDSRKAEAERLVRQGFEQSQTSQYEAAIESFQQALAICKTIGNRRWEGYVLVNLSNPYSNMGNYGQAIEYSKQSLAIAREFGDRQLEEMSLGNLGIAYLYLNDYGKAIEYFQEVLALSRQIKDYLGEGKVLGLLGVAYKSLGNYGKAIDYSKQSLALSRQIKDHLSEGDALGNLGGAYGSLGEYAKAIEYQQQSLALSRQIKDRRGEGISLQNLGNFYHSVGDYTKAIEYYQQSLSISKQIHNHQSKGQVLGNLGAIYFDLGNSAEAIEYLQKSLELAQQIHDREGEGRGLERLGDVYLLILDNSTKAIEYFQKSLALAQQIHDREGESIALLDLGCAYDDLGDYGKALKYYQQSLAIEQQIHNREGEGWTLNNLGFTLYESGNLTAAEKTLLDAIKVWESLRAGLGRNDASKISIFDRHFRTYRVLQKVFIDHNKAKAALEISERGRARTFVELLSSRLSSPLATQSTITSPKAQQIQQIAKVQNATLVEYSIIEDWFKVQDGKQWRESELFIWVIKPSGEGEFRRIDLKKLWQQQKTSLKEFAPNSPSVVPAAPKSPDLITHTPESGQESAIPWRNPLAISLLLLTAGSVIGIGFWSGRFLTKKATQNSPLNQRWLVPSLLLVLVVGSSGGLFFWMTHSQAIANNRSLRNDSLLAQLVDNTRESVKTRGRGLGIVPLGQKASQGDRLQQLHQILIQPIADLLPSDPNARVIFIPQSSLFLVPFPALKDASGKYLIEKHTILTAPSIQVLDLTRKQKQRIETLGVGSREALVVGNPTMPKVPPQIGEPPQQLPSLPGAEEEARAIASLLKTPVITGEKATKQAILQKMSNARIVHLATHGILDDIRGLGSAIALAPSGKDDGLLTAEQILDLKLNAELVVLSACDTGRGKITGDGVIGLSRSLITAGVPSVLVSLWSVPDAPTASLMTEFYRNLQHNPDKAQALRQAMLTIMKQHPDPRDWAAFTLIGEFE